MKKILLSILVCNITISLFSQVLIKDIRNGAVASNPRIFGSINSGILFTATTDQEGTEPWFSNGTEAGTILLKDIKTGPGSSSTSTFYVKVKDEYYFVANHSGNFGISLWKTDGTVNGTLMVKDLGSITIPPGGGPVTAIPMVAFKDQLYFVYEDMYGKELWKSDGTDTGTRLVKDINQNIAGSSSPAGMCVFQDFLYFFADDAINGRELWRTDGTNNGTVLFKDIYPGTISSNTISAPSLFVFKDKLYFGAQGDHDMGVELYQSDGTANGTALFKDIHTAQQASSFPALIVITDNYFLFRATSAAEGMEPWYSDGTVQGTALLSDIQPGGNSMAYNATVINNLVVFIVIAPLVGAELWVTDGSPSGTKLLKDIMPGIAGSYPGYLTKNNNKIYFTAEDSTNGIEIWETDGSTENTRLYFQVNPGKESCKLSSIISWNNQLYVGVAPLSDAKGVELYRIDASNDIKQSSNNAVIKMYPNPLGSGNTIHFAGFETSGQLTVFNLIGEQILTTTVLDGIADLNAEILNGVYFLELKGETQNYRFKLVINR